MGSFSIPFHSANRLFHVSGYRSTDKSYGDARRPLFRLPPPAPLPPTSPHLGTWWHTLLPPPFPTHCGVALSLSSQSFCLRPFAPSLSFSLSATCVQLKEREAAGGRWGGWFVDGLRRWVAAGEGRGSVKQMCESQSMTNARVRRHICVRVCVRKCVRVCVCKSRAPIYMLYM